MSVDFAENPLSVACLLAAYRGGYFPMAYDKHDDEIAWFSPPQRGVVRIKDFNIPRGVKRAMKKQPFTLSINRDFAGVIAACATLNKNREDTWINQPIEKAYIALHQAGHAHSVESWCDGKLVGGLYGVSIGGVFFGESMFSHQPEASKIALVTLVDVLAEAGYRLLDTQYVNPHLLQFGVRELSKSNYMSALKRALNVRPNPSSLFSTISVRKGLAS
jgi:leucyl/phenylalanyl-tRNA--protein transferase